MLMSGRKGLARVYGPFRLLRQIEDIRGQRTSICIFGVENRQPAIKNNYSGIQMVKPTHKSIFPQMETRNYD